MYLVKASRLLKKLYHPDMIWKIPDTNGVYLTFDDGPHPLATNFVLELLDKYNAHATFFCIGDNIDKYPDIYQEILRKGHSVGNHTHNHLNGWKFSNKNYIKNILIARKRVNNNLFRPPYGKMKKKQAQYLVERGFKIVMWDLLSGDFDTHLSPQACWENVRNNIEPGSIVVFHDSSKAWERMKFALPLTLEYCNQQQWEMKSIRL